MFGGEQIARSRRGSSVSGLGSKPAPSPLSSEHLSHPPSLPTSPNSQLTLRCRWRHWYCVTSQVLGNLNKEFTSADQIDGFEELREEDQDRITKALEEGSSQSPFLSSSTHLPLFSPLPFPSYSSDSDLALL